MIEGLRESSARNDIYYEIQLKEIIGFVDNYWSLLFLNCDKVDLHLELNENIRFLLLLLLLLLLSVYFILADVL